MRSVVETITPKKAQQWLTNNNRNRPLSMKWAEFLAEVIKRGEWHLNGDSIRFNCEGGIVDGQHRLQAVVIAGIPIQSLVVRGVEAKAFDTIDQGKKRSAADMFARDGEHFYSALAGACRFLYYYEIGSVRGAESGHGRNTRVFTPTTAQQMLAKNPGLRKSAEFISPHRNDVNFPPAIAVALHYLASRKHPDQADDFFTKLATGEDINRSDPVYVVRKRLAQNKTDQSKLRGYILAAFVAKAWNATITKKPMSVLRWKDDEDFPEIA